MTVVKKGKIKEVFQRLYPHLEPTEHLAKQIRLFRLEFMTKNQDHMAFFGGNLTGVHVVRFTSKDRDRFFTDICQVDEYELEEELLKTGEVNENFIVSSDALNQLGMYLIHIYCASNLKPEVKHNVMREIALVLFYRFITSILFNFFKYPVDPALAEAVYSQLNNKFLIKQLGSWQAVLEYRCDRLIEKESIHYNTFLKYENDYDIIKLINDTQGRMKDMIKNIYGVFDQVRKRGLRVKSTSMLLEKDGDVILKDKTQGLQKYTQYLHSIVTDEGSFIKQDIIDILEKIVPTAPPKLVEETLRWCSKNYKYDSKEIVHKLIDKTMLHSFAYLSDNRTVYKNTGDLHGLITRLRGVYSSSRSTDENLFEIREIAEKVVKSTGMTRNNVVIASTRSALLLYLVIRAFTMQHYSKSG